MITFAGVITFAAIVILILVIIGIFMPRGCGSREHFDTYHNHDIGSYTVYKSEGQNPQSVDQAAVQAKYTWSERDPSGMTVYDKMYENWATHQNYNPEDYSYGLRSVRDREGKDSYLDTKFEILDGENTDALYSYKDTYSKQPATVFNGQIISLSQKNY